MSTGLTIYVQRAEAAASWLREYPQMERGRQIAAAFASKASVHFVDLGDIPIMGSKPAETSFGFIYADLEQTLAEFPEVGRRLNFPPGTRLIHFGQDWTTSDAAICTVVTW